MSAACAGLVAAALNVPFGAWREHTKKFSPEWFLAVHATIPLIAPLRKAVLMPQWAIAFTIASAIAGQTAGSRLERARLARQSSKEPSANELQHGSSRSVGHSILNPRSVSSVSGNMGQGKAAGSLLSGCRADDLAWGPPAGACWSMWPEFSCC